MDLSTIAYEYFKWNFISNLPNAEAAMTSGFLREYPDLPLQTQQKKGAAAWNRTYRLNQKEIKLIFRDPHNALEQYAFGAHQIYIMSWNWLNSCTQKLSDQKQNKWRKRISSNCSLLQKQEGESNLNWRIIFLLKTYRAVQIIDGLTVNCFLKTLTFFKFWRGSIDINSFMYIVAV